MKHKWCELRSRGCRLQRDRDVRVCVFIQGKNNTEKKRTETQQHSNLFWWDVMFAKEREIWVLEEWEKNWMKQRPDWWWWKGQNGKFTSRVVKKDKFDEEKRGFFFFLNSAELYCQKKEGSIWTRLLPKPPRSCFLNFSFFLLSLSTHLRPPRGKTPLFLLGPLCPLKMCTSTKTSLVFSFVF